MSKYAKIQSLCFSTVLAFTSHSISAPQTCPSTVSPELCEKLMSHEGGDWLSCKVVFNRPPMDPGDSSDPKTDAITDTSDVASDTTTPSYLVEYANAMFGKYDFRLWDDHLEPGSADGGTIPSWSFPARVGGSYRGFATKNSILSLAAESYIQVVEDWQSPVPVSLSRTQRLFSRPTVPHAFNVRGQRLGTNRASTLVMRVGVP
jgi:hypothetical protein